MEYKSGIKRNLKEIAQQLGVSKVVEGSVRRSGNHVRVSVQLIDALTDRHPLGGRLDRTLADSLAMQGELATEIAASVGGDADSAGESASARTADEQYRRLRCLLAAGHHTSRNVGARERGACGSIL